MVTMVKTFPIKQHIAQLRRCHSQVHHAY